MGLALLLAVPGPAAAQRRFPSFEVRALDGSANNLAHPTWGQSGTPYRRGAPAAYRDGSGVVPGPSARFISDRIFNDVGQNLFSRRVSQWAWTWGQFLDHTFGLAQDGPESRPIPFNRRDPLEAFRNDLGAISFKRDAVVPGSGSGPANPRQQINTVSSYIDGWPVYGGTRARLDWLRDGPRMLLTPLGYLPPVGIRGNAAAAPAMKLDGQLRGRPQDAVVAGDVRANENIALTAVHTLFAREHNRIVDALPLGLSPEQRFQIARRVVGAEQQFITYNEFLPALGVRLGPYRGYRPDVDASLGNEFATVAYRAHSMIHGEFEIAVAAGALPATRLAALRRVGVEVGRPEDGRIELAVPLNVAFFNPGLVPDIGLGAILLSLGAEAQYRNDEQIDNSLRSVMFEMPGPNATNPAACFSDPSATGCFRGVTDLGAIDIQRGRDHGMPGYNRLRRAFGLSPRTSFTAITGERTASFPADRQINPRRPIDDPDILDFVSLRGRNGRPIALGSEEAEDEAVSGTRRTTLAARLRAIYRRADAVDGFVGMMAEPHVPGTEFGPLQLAMWTRQFRALRDGDRFFYAGDPVLERIEQRFGITYRRTLADLIARNAGVPRGALRPNVFLAPAS